MREFDIDRFLLNMEARYASNNWRKMHGFPLRRGVINKRHEEWKKKRDNVFILGAPGCGKARYFIMPQIEKS